MANNKKFRRTFEEVFTEAGLIPEWMERGRVEGKAEVARNLFSMGMPVEEIAKAVQMPIEELCVG